MDVRPKDKNKTMQYQRYGKRQNHACSGSHHFGRLSLRLLRSGAGSRANEFGFTLIELMISVAIFGILLAIAMPDFNETINRTRVGMQGEELVTDLALARSEAATRSVRTTMCISSNGTSCVTAATPWETGRLVFVDNNADGAVTGTETILKYTQALRGDTTVSVAGFSGGALSISYGPFGGLIPSASGTFTLCSSASSVGRQISVAATGRATNVRVVCP
jgi:type IV fimbrial biogenesis protein FimT